MRHRLFTRIVTLVLASYVALPAAAHGAGPAKSSTAACASAQTEVVAATIAKANSATLCLLNRERAARDLSPLKLDRRLSGSAVAHSRDMVRRGYFEHDSPDGRSPFQRMLATSYVPKGASWTLGENIGWGTLSLAQPAALVRAWMKSPAHRANILNPRFREIGIGIAVGVPLADPSLDGQAGATYTTDFGRHS
ncbi:CAP domain-containing protein [Conexibacter sp. JD483]|uniref:CAP domain-containing protein n=1 Tax=unclassified Conexibacter TaxID=2627773 RepID=UPI0027178E09|nr:MULTISPECIES: CAP domain-containing protein [unclassified Conexibacter]MDO8188284.1 CAP domain-containing protein [Conexibacter sp. CPCC 205706]MDO8198964.1 CAP domain-containing protein [Conexibacter sp. CPCC 205762]MDR9371002.1 CAP domain-containing protein [Conexibacter sp. JD483]